MTLPLRSFQFGNPIRGGCSRHPSSCRNLPSFPRLYFFSNFFGVGLTFFIFSRLLISLRSSLSILGIDFGLFSKRSRLGVCRVHSQVWCLGAARWSEWQRGGHGLMLLFLPARASDCQR